MRGGARPAGRRCDLLFVVLSPALGSMMFFDRARSPGPKAKIRQPPEGPLNRSYRLICCLFAVRALTIMRRGGIFIQRNAPEQ